MELSGEASPGREAADRDRVWVYIEAVQRRAEDGGDEADEKEDGRHSIEGLLSMILVYIMFCVVLKEIKG